MSVAGEWTYKSSLTSQELKKLRTYTHYTQKKKRKQEREKKSRESKQFEAIRPRCSPVLASAIHCGGCQWPQGYEGCSSESLHISLGGARHKAGHDVTSNLHTLRVRNRVDAPPYRYMQPSCRCTREIQRFWEIGVQETRSLSPHVSFIRRTKFARVGMHGRLRKCSRVESHGNEKSIFIGLKQKSRSNRFDAAKFTNILAQLILAWNWPRISLIVGLPYRKNRRDFYVEYKSIWREK